MGERLFAGLMSGSSCDGLDAVLIAIEDGLAPAWRVRHRVREGYTDELRSRLLDLPQAPAAEVAALHRLLGELGAALVLRLFAEAGVKPSEVAAIGSHGHTAVHLSPPAAVHAATLQIGDAAWIAEATGIPVVSDFRAADIAAGGQGAPLVPAADEVLFSRYLPPEGLILLNLGGIANVTCLPAPGAAGVLRRLAFDTGPGIMVCDALARRASDGRCAFDAGGELAAGGEVIEALLDYWLGLPFFALPPPRTASREDFGERFVEAALARFPLERWEDLLSTAVELTAVAVREAVARWVEPEGHAGLPPALWVAGGGARNATLFGRLEKLFRGGGRDVARLEERVPMGCEAREAAAFAVLARETLAGRFGNWPEATGARRPVVLGKVSFATPPGPG
jgi:anhydro-N-acetylmuramic acid kinase